MLRLTTLGSSSKGNCYLIRTADGVLVIECGSAYKKILRALDFDPVNIAGCLLTHEHADHARAIKDVMSAGIDVYASGGTFDALGICGYHANKVEAGKQFNLGSFAVLPFETQHEAREPLGYLIHHPEFGKLLFATDTYYIRYRFSGLSYVMIECNYSRTILQRNIDKGRLAPALKRKLLGSHFSLENVKKFFAANDLSRLREIMLLHLSDLNSNAALFKNEIEKLTGVPVTVCG